MAKKAKATRRKELGSKKIKEVKPLMRLAGDPGGTH
jgi:hypothetical protein